MEIEDKIDILVDRGVKASIKHSLLLIKLRDKLFRGRR